MRDVLGQWRWGSDGKQQMSFKFEKLKVWKLALEYINLIYGIADKLPPDGRFNVRSQIIR